MWCYGLWFSDGLGSVCVIFRLLDDLGGIFKPKWFYDCLCYSVLEMLPLISNILNNTFQSLNAFNISSITDLYILLQNISKKQNCCEWWIFSMYRSHCIFIIMAFNKTLLIGPKYGSNPAVLNLETRILGELTSSGKQERICK